jgi:hypothetical protein
MESTNMEATMIAPEQATRLLPLLRSIGEEILERAAHVVHIEEMIAALSTAPRVHATEIASNQAELAYQRRELRIAERELERLGCQIDSLAPLTFRIKTSDDHGFTWRLGDPTPTGSVS